MMQREKGDHVIDPPISQNTPSAAGKPVVWPTANPQRLPRPAETDTATTTPGPGR